MQENTRYDHIGENYNIHRQADLRIVSQIKTLLGLSGNAIVADIGAGTGNYSNALADEGFYVKAIEPSAVMRAQAGWHGRVEWFHGSAEAIPLDKNSVQGIIAIFAIHHFSSLEQAGHEMGRICETGNTVIFTFDPRQGQPFWLIDYFPHIWKQAHALFPNIGDIVSLLEQVTERQAELVSFPIPHDITDKFLAGGWRTPTIYLDETIRNSMSGFVLADPAEVRKGVMQLADDLESGQWEKKYGSILNFTEYDLGYRFIKLSREGF